MDDVDLRAYLNRIDLVDIPDPTPQTLRALVAAHNGTIPFENLDPLLGVPVEDLSAEALLDKLVRRRRGGYCYEHNGLMCYVLEQLGYDVERLAGRVVWMAEPDAPLPAETHHVLSVGVPGVDGRFLVDVGFGGQTPSSPLRLEVGPEQRTRHEPHRLLAGGPAGAADELTLQARLPNGWRSLYAFTTHPRPLIDLRVGSWYVSTHPASTFVVGLTAALVTDDARWNLRGRHLAIHGEHATKRQTFDTAGQVLDVLATRFGIDLDEVGDRSRLAARVTAVLDA